MPRENTFCSVTVLIEISHFIKILVFNILTTKKVFVNGPNSTLTNKTEIIHNKSELKE